MLQCELSNSNPNVILLSKAGAVPGKTIKLFGYKGIGKSLSANSVVAILVKNNISFKQIQTTDENTLAIHTPTNMRPVIIYTSYIPLRLPHSQ